MVLRKMNDLQACTSASDIGAHADGLWGFFQSYIQDQLGCSSFYTLSSSETGRSGSETISSQRNNRTMASGTSRQQHGGTSSESLRRLAPRPNYASAPVQASGPSLPGVDSVPSLISDGCSGTTATFSSLPVATSDCTWSEPMTNICSLEFPKPNDEFLNPDLSSYDWATSLGDFDFNSCLDTQVSSDNVTGLDDHGSMQLSSNVEIPENDNEIED